MSLSADRNKAKVYLVGAGPGQADLITVRGAHLLRTADCIIYDKLANPALLEYASPDAEIIHVPKRIGSRSVKQQDINELLLEKAATAKTIVRLKGGDPCIFGRGAEEAALLAEAGIDFEIIPGVTAAIAAAEYSGIMLTHRDYSSQVAFITGREAEGKEDSNIDWSVLAKFPGTIVFYMGVGNLQLIADQLIQNGAKSDTPAALIADATLPTQRIAQAPLSRITKKCKQEKIEPPAIIIIGPAAASDDRINWFMNKPLFGRSIVITRDRLGNAELAAKIIERSGNPIAFPTIKLKPLTRTNQFIKTLAHLSEFNWIIFTSVNGVSFFFEAVEKLNKDARVFASAKIAAIGTQTAGRLRQFGIIPDFVPTEFTSAELGKQLIAFRNLKNKKVLLLRSEAASNELVDILVTAGADVTQTPVYTIESERTEPDWLIDKIKKAEIDWLTFASPSAAGYFFQQILPELVNSSSVKVASIGPVTSKQLQDLNIAVDTEAKDHTFDALLDAIESAAR